MSIKRFLSLNSIDEAAGQSQYLFTIEVIKRRYFSKNNYTEDVQFKISSIELFFSITEINCIGEWENLMRMRKRNTSN